MNDTTPTRVLTIRRPVSPQTLRPVIESVESGGTFEDLERGVPFREAGFDSLDIFNLVMAVETACGFEIPDADLPELQTLQSLARYLDRRLS
jgi:acyl carrier protein